MPMSYNAWLYGFANPVKYTDPSGYCPLANKGDECWRELLKIEQAFPFVNLQKYITDTQWWTLDELSLIESNLEILDNSASFGLENLLKNREVRVKRVRTLTGVKCAEVLPPENDFIGAVIFNNKEIVVYDDMYENTITNCAPGGFGHEIAHLIDYANNSDWSAKFERYVGGSTQNGGYDPGSEVAPKYGNGNPTNRGEDFAESLAEYVYEQGSSERIMEGEKRWIFIESLLTTGTPPKDLKDIKPWWMFWCN